MCSNTSVFWFNVRRTDLFCLVFYLTLSTQVMKPLIIIKHWRLLFDDYGTGYMSAIKFIKTRQSLLKLIFEKLVLFIMEWLFLLKPWTSKTSVKKITVNDMNYWCDSKLGQGDNEFQAQNNHNYNNYYSPWIIAPSANLVMTERSEVQSQKNELWVKRMY